MNDVVWVGIRESEIENVDFINNSINIFGNNKNSLQNIYNVSINHNDYKNDKIIIFPSSIQIIEVQNNRLTYKGCDFIAYKNIISDDINKKVRNYTNLIAKILKEKGYRGILGIDSIVYQNEVYFMEVNPRYQNSSTILNMGLKDSDLPSLQELEYKIFTNENINNIFDFDVNYSSYLIEEGDNNKSSDDFIKILDYNKKITNRYDGSYTCTKVYNKPIFNKKYTL